MCSTEAEFIQLAKNYDIYISEWPRSWAMCGFGNYFLLAAFPKCIEGAFPRTRPFFEKYRATDFDVFSYRFDRTIIKGNAMVAMSIGIEFDINRAKTLETQYEKMQTRQKLENIFIPPQ